MLEGLPPEARESYELAAQAARNFYNARQINSPDRLRTCRVFMLVCQILALDAPEPTKRVEKFKENARQIYRTANDEELPFPDDLIIWRNIGRLAASSFYLQKGANFTDDHDLVRAIVNPDGRLEFRAS
ncbi:MAG: hypothetical protein ACREGF_03840 [Candidatus Saccharimonadales bacterium]